ncbi:MAG: hypothetical protein MUO77_15205 [Anaerolineales bacterium]|nr:hypothetical protein [Anaerolineales bacterium]
MNSKLLRNILFGMLVLGYFYYAHRYIEATSITVGADRYYILFDDAMISMRYAYNLAHGNGLVWNAGEYVDGFTNPLWVGYMALFHILPIAASRVSLYIQWSGALFLGATLYFVRRIVEEYTDSLFTMLAAVAFTAFYSPLISWDLLGMEVSILALILTAVVFLSLTKNRFAPWTLTLLAVSTLFRFDMAVPFIVMLGVMYFVKPQYRKQNLIWGLGLLVLFLGGQTLARYFYYGDFLPNTYYLKVTGWPFALRILRGLYALVWFIYYTNWMLFLLPFTLLLFRRDWKINLLFLILLAQMAYSVYVGGDAWEEHGGANRYIAIAMPLFFAVFAVSVEELRRKTVAVLGAGRIAAAGSQVAWLVIFVISILNFNLLMGDWKYIERWQFTRKPDYVAGSENNLRIALALQNATKPGASIAVIGAGTIPYLLPDRYAIDVLGKADPVIARESVRTPMSYEDIPDMRPGHMKWDYARTFGELQPDVIVSIWEGTDEEAAPYLKNYVYAVVGEGVKVYLKKDSPNVWWDKVIIKN